MKEGQKAPEYIMAVGHNCFSFEKLPDKEEADKSLEEQGFIVDHVGSLEHQERVRKAREKGVLTEWEKAAKEVLENFDEFFVHACNIKDSALLYSLHLICKRGFIDTFLFEGKSMFFAAQYNQNEELIKRCLVAIEREISSYQKVINSVIANEFLEHVYCFREHMQNVIKEAKEVELAPYALIESLDEVKTSGTKPRQLKTEVYKELAWHELFKDSKDSEEILRILKAEGFITETGEWKLFPLKLTLVALCMDLEDKGYLKSAKTITNPVKANAFSVQFKVVVSNKLFQPAMRNSAEHLKEHFKLINKYQPSKEGPNSKF